MENNFKDDTLSAIYNYLIEKGNVGISNDDTEAYDAAALFTIRIGNKMWSNRQHPDTDEIYLFRIYSLVEKLNSNPENRGIVEFIIGVINNVVLKECNGRDDMALKELFNGMFVEFLNTDVLDKVRNDISGLLTQGYVIDELGDVSNQGASILIKDVIIPKMMEGLIKQMENEHRIRVGSEVSSVSYVIKLPNGERESTISLN